MIMKFKVSAPVLGGPFQPALPQCQGALPFASPLCVSQRPANDDD